MNGLEIDVGEEILEKCRQASALASALEEDGSRHSIVHELARNMKVRAEAIEEQCRVKRYSLRFNGKVGIGKTMAICSLTGLIDRNVLENAGDYHKLPLLKTASGRTTICETRILKTEGQSCICLAGMPEEEFQIYVKEYCDDIFGSQEMSLSAEIHRAISNMAGYPCKAGEPRRDESDILDYLRKSGAESLDCTVENLSDAVGRNIRYARRKLTEFVFTEGRFEDWLRDNIEKLNDGRIPEAPFPSQISIYVNIGDLDLGIPEYISDVVDTRGIGGGGSSRRDIAFSMVKPDTVTVMCDRINSFGSEREINELLEHAHSSARDSFHRIFLLGLERGQELIYANGAGDYEEGLSVKKKEAMREMGQKKIPLKEGNIGCLNALAGIQYSTTGAILETDEAAYRKTREDFWELLKTGLQGMYRMFYCEIQDMISNLRSLEKRQFPEGIVFRFADCRKLVEDTGIQAEEPLPGLQRELRNKMDACHAGVVRGCVNRRGSYGGLDIYDVSFLAGGRAFDQNCKTGTEILLARLKDIFNPEEETERICLSVVKREIEDAYSEYYKKSCDSYKMRVYEGMKNSPVWWKLYGLWGTGGGYKETVIDEVRGEMKEQGIGGKLKENDCCAEYRERLVKIMEIYR